ncbi:MAG: DUF1569 domain-containing protein [Ignavibacteria bacterium]
MENILNTEDRELILERISKLDENSKAVWGKMNVNEMIVHLADPLRVAIGEKHAEFLKSEYSESGLRHKIIYDLEWPQNSPTSPEFKRGETGSELLDFENDLKTLHEVINKFVNKSEEISFTIHPIFGDISNEDWGRLMWKHMDHHLKQFGS